MKTDLLLAKKNLLERCKAQSLSEFNGVHRAIRTEAETALLALENLDFPNRKNEEWKYTGFEKILSQDISLAAIPHQIDLPSFQLPEFEAHYITLVNGHLKDASSLKEEEGVEFYNLKDACSQTDFNQYYNKIKNIDDDIYTAANTATPTNGLFLRIKANAKIEKPIVIVNIISANENTAWIQPRHLIVVEENAHVKLMEYQRTQGSQAHFTNQLIEIQVGAHSFAQHIVLQDDVATSSSLHNTYVNLAKSSVFTNYVYSLGGAIVRNNIILNLLGSHAEGNLYGLYLVEGKEHVDHHTTVNHQVANCTSNEYYKGVINDYGTAVFNGKVWVQKDAQKTNAYQQNRNILLSDNATINTKPQLEIWADDVKCSHGATVGQLDDDQLFYLKARGIGEAEAKNLMVYAFASEIVEKVRNEAIKNHLFKAVRKKLNFKLD